MTYAKETNVAISKSRGQVDKLLREWGAKRVMWGDDWEAGQVMLRFVWSYEDVDYGARIVLQLATDLELKAAARHRTTYVFLPGKFRNLQEDRGKSEHRLLLLWLKASFNAVEAGLVKAEALFLPFLEGADGQTVAEAILPRLPAMLDSGGTRNLLGTG